MYAITGASGNTGKLIAEQLLAKGQRVRVIGRNAERLQPLVDQGAEARITDLADTPALTKAFTGTDAVYTIIPPDLTAPNFREYQNRLGESIATAIRNAGVKNVVNLSSVGAHQPGGVGPVNGLHDQEERLNKLEGVNVLHLRSAYFMENHFLQVQLMKDTGAMGSPIRPDLTFPQIATKDIANYAAERLHKLDFTGKTVSELLGPGDISMAESTRIIGEAIGTANLEYRQFSYDDARNALVGMGASEDAAGNVVELYRAFNEGTCTPTQQRTRENTTPTTLREFSKVIAQAYQPN